MEEAADLGRGAGLGRAARRTAITIDNEWLEVESGTVSANAHICGAVEAIKRVRSVVNVLWLCRSESRLYISGARWSVRAWIRWLKLVIRLAGGKVSKLKISLKTFGIFCKVCRVSHFWGMEGSDGVGVGAEPAGLYIERSM